ncbi:MAG: aminomethyl-transferring glycine dehydrogenase subunit GcvPB [Deltaproteobacteria bacterium]|nr:aminomethyl-transferring glycine dehydrogenase subunit GcvPB [Deltaproteobacteria bacterium]
MTPGSTGLVLEEPLLCELSRPGRQSCSLPHANDVPTRAPEATLPAALLRQTPAALPEISEADLVRHFTRLSSWNYCKDAGFFPLGSCTMKHNPRTNEAVAALPGFAYLHPYQDSGTAQGALALIAALEEALKAISGMEAISTCPAAGSHGELTGLMVIRAYLQDRGDPRSRVLIPDSAHGTNPASAAICGYRVTQIPSGPDGLLEPSTVANAMSDDVAAIMVTNPNTLGIFERNIREICDIVHARGGLVYCDGANLNALMGIAQIGEMGVDVMHFNLHKTFTTPHGGGGPGAGPIGVRQPLAPYLPIPRVVKTAAGYGWDASAPKSIGRIKAFYGNFGMLVRAYTYIREMGAPGLRHASEYAVLNANYIRAQLTASYHLPYATPALHECVLTDKWQQPGGVKTLDIAKRLMDYGFHPPTIYFPLLVAGAMMIEPTETESKESCDQFIAAMRAIAKEAQHTPATLTEAPHHTFRRRLDEVMAARSPILTWHQLKG